MLKNMLPFTRGSIFHLYVVVFGDGTYGVKP